jgi:hypothetical protein
MSTDEHAGPEAHGGYALHSHDVLPDHQGAAWDPEPCMRSRRGPQPVPEDTRSWYHRKDGTVCVSGHDSISMLCGSGGGPVTAGPPAPQPDGYLTPEQHIAEAGRLLWVIGNREPGERTPRSLLELAVLALAHAVTALAASGFSPQGGSGESPAEGGSADPGRQDLRSRILTAMGDGSGRITAQDLAVALLVPSPVITAELGQMAKDGIVTGGWISWRKIA